MTGRWTAIKSKSKPVARCNPSTNGERGRDWLHLICNCSLLMCSTVTCNTLMLADTLAQCFSVALSLLMHKNTSQYFQVGASPPTCPYLFETDFPLDDVSIQCMVLSVNFTLLTADFDNNCLTYNCNYAKPHKTLLLNSIIGCQTC